MFEISRVRPLPARRKGTSGRWKKKGGDVSDSYDDGQDVRASDLEYTDSDYDISLPGLKRRLHRLEKQAEYQDIEALLAAIREIRQMVTDKRDIERFEKIGFPLPEVNESRSWRPLYIPPCVSNRVPIYFNAGPYNKKTIGGYRREGPTYPANVIAKAGEFSRLAESRRRSLEFWQRAFGGILSNDRRAREIESLREEELQWWRLVSRFRALLERCAEPLRLGLESGWPEIILQRRQLAEREAVRDKRHRAEILYPKPPTKEEVYRARVAAMDKKSRETIASLRDQVRKTSECPYCGNSVGPGGHHLDHIVPVSRGGLNTVDNLVYICARCNLKKGDSGLLAFAKKAGIEIEPLIERLHRLGKHV